MILFIDTGWKDLGFALFTEYGEPVLVESLTIKSDVDFHGHITKIWSKLVTISSSVSSVVYENYTVHDDDTGKSKKGQMTLFCNGIIAGFACAYCLNLEEVKNRHWNSVYSRYKAHKRINSLTPLTPPKSANDHASDAFKMGVAWLVERGVIK